MTTIVNHVDVYVVRDGALQPAAVFSTREKAEDYVSKHDPSGSRCWDVERMPVDPPMWLDEQVDSRIEERRRR